MTVDRFTDKMGRSWLIEIDVIGLKRVRQSLGINLLELLIDGSDLPARLGDPSDPILLVDTLFTLCQEQASSLHVSDVEFGRSLTPESISDGLEAILEGVVNFSPRQVRPAYRKVLEATRRIRKAAAERVTAALADPNLDAAIEKQVNQILNQPSGMQTHGMSDATSLPESQASNRGDIRPDH